MTQNNFKPKISIVTPVYNGAQYIEDALNSVKEQDYPNFEHIVVDGGSTDGTIDILKKYEGKHKLKCISLEHKGQSCAINAGFKMASGDIIGWLNADDVYVKGTFKKVVDIFAIKKADAVYSKSYFADKDLNITGRTISFVPSRLIMLFFHYISSNTFFFSRKILDNFIFIDESLDLAMDNEFFVHILSKGYRVMYIKDYFSIFRRHGSNKSLQRCRSAKDILLKERLMIFNRYFKFKLPENKTGIIMYDLMRRIVVFPLSLYIRFDNFIYALKFLF